MMRVRVTCEWQADGCRRDSPKEERETAKELQAASNRAAGIPSKRKFRVAISEILVEITTVITLAQLGTPELPPPVCDWCCCCCCSTRCTAIRTDQRLFAQFSLHLVAGETVMGSNVSSPTWPLSDLCLSGGANTDGIGLFKSDPHFSFGDCWIFRLTFKISEECLDIKWCINVPTIFSDLCSWDLMLYSVHICHWLEYICRNMKFSFLCYYRDVSFCSGLKIIMLFDCLNPISHYKQYLR